MFEKASTFRPEQKQKKSYKIIPLLDPNFVGVGWTEQASLHKYCSCEANEHCLFANSDAKR